MSLSYAELTEIHHRKSVRLKNHDYTHGTYFVTMCAKNGEHLFGEIVDGEMRLSEYGKIVEEEWLRTQHIRPEIILDVHQVMPNHIHAIVELKPVIACRGVWPYAPTGDGASITNSREFQSPSLNLGALIRGFKGSVTKRVRIFDSYDGHLWQRNYHEHIIRNSAELKQIRTYIQDNPRNWEKDKENIKI